MYEQIPVNANYPAGVGEREISGTRLRVPGYLWSPSAVNVPHDPTHDCFGDPVYPSEAELQADEKASGSAREWIE